MGSLVMNENQPSTSPLTRPDGSNWTGTVVSWLCWMLLALRNASHTEVFVDCTPIFLPSIACGLARGLDASDMMQNGFFWYWAPIVIRSAPLTILDAVMSGDEMQARAWPEATTSSWFTDGPPASSVIFVNPAAV